jgi:hypothetical protein
MNYSFKVVYKTLISSTESDDPDNAGLGIIRDLYVLKTQHMI